MAFRDGVFMCVCVLSEVRQVYSWDGTDTATLLTHCRTDGNASVRKVIERDTRETRRESEKDGWDVQEAELCMQLHKHIFCFLEH